MLDSIHLVGRLEGRFAVDGENKGRRKPALIRLLLFQPAARGFDAGRVYGSRSFLNVLDQAIHVDHKSCAIRYAAGHGDPVSSCRFSLKVT